MAKENNRNAPMYQGCKQEVSAAMLAPARQAPAQFAHTVRSPNQVARARVAGEIIDQHRPFLIIHNAPRRREKFRRPDDADRFFFHRDLHTPMRWLRQAVFSRYGAASANASASMISARRSATLMCSKSICAQGRYRALLSLICVPRTVTGTGHRIATTITTFGLSRRSRFRSGRVQGRDQRDEGIHKPVCGPHTDARANSEARRRPRGG